MQEIKIGKKELAVRDFFENTHEGQVPHLTVQQLYSQFMTSEIGASNPDISYGLFNGVIKKLRAETQGVYTPNVQTQSTVARASAQAQMEENEVVMPDIVDIGTMDFPDFRKVCTGSVFDQILSDHDTEGGLILGTANIVIGESGVGKSTVLLDTLAKIKATNPEARILYISSEMTRNDLYFYFKKMPSIASIPTILLMDYITSRFDKTLELALKGDYDVALIDSYQDIIVKLKDVLGWKSTKAEAWLTALIVDASDKHGKAIFAIQHMTKGGQYVGGTYLKHATQSMMELKFDEGGRRYAEFSKNRRGGSQVGKRLYYSMKNGEVVWDEVAWRQENLAAELNNAENHKREELENEFNTLFLSVKNHADKDRDNGVTDAEVVDTEAEVVE
jgi:hypothetical protein